MNVLDKIAPATVLRPQAVRQADQARPRTQDKVPVIAARDNVLVIRDGSVVGGIGVSSIDDALLTDEAVRAKLISYRNDVLKQLRFDVQLLVGTRPQNLEEWHRKLFESASRMQLFEERLNALNDGLAEYSSQGVFTRDAFVAFFGFAPDDLYGVPGKAHELAALLAGVGEPVVDETVDFASEIEHSVDCLVRWQKLIILRANFVERHLQAHPKPVRTIYLLTSFYPRIAGKVVSKLKGPLTETEIAESMRVLDHRCGQLQRGLERMQLAGWRASHDELVGNIQHFYHPSLAYLAARDGNADRSVSLRMMRARVS